MGNRMIRESLLESDKISSLSDFDFRLWVTLILLADDYGVVDARPQIIKGSGYPLRDRVTVSDIKKALQRLAVAGCVFLYTVDGKPYAQFPKWSTHQRLRNSKHKYPTIENSDDLEARAKLRQLAATCGDFEKVAANGGEVEKIAANGGKSPPELELEVELEEELEREVETHTRAREQTNKPTEDDVKAYAQKMGYTNFNAGWFVQYYTKRDWLVFGKPITDWREKVDSWAAHEKEKEERRIKTNPALQYTQRDNSAYENFEYFDLDNWKGETTCSQNG